MPDPTDTEWRVRPRAEQLATRCDLRVAALAGEEWSVLSVDELRACGLHPTTSPRGCRAAGCNPWYRGVYVVGHGQSARCEGTVARRGQGMRHGAVLSHYAAAALWRLLEWDGGSPR